uniref:Uncharacterized protein n=1 Tax=Rhizophora mucronata TaxID=61149 RepID=A0A2P2PAX2_RHIMU
MNYLNCYLIYSSCLFLYVYFGIA